MSNDIGSEVISKVREVLETFARNKRTVSFSEIEERIGQKLRLDQWRQILNPIYEELRSQGKPDLTAIIVYKSGELRGYPPFFSDGAEPQSRPFNPNNKRQLERWTNEVNRVFSTWQKKND